MQSRSHKLPQAAKQGSAVSTLTLREQNKRKGKKEKGEKDRRGPCGDWDADSTPSREGCWLYTTDIGL